MAKSKSPRKETKKAPKNKNLAGKAKIPDLSQMMTKLPGDNVKSLKIKVKFHKDKGDKDDDG